MKVELSVAECATLKRVYRHDCGGGSFEDCPSFQELLAQSFARPAKHGP
jgi:hypothetical protein